MQKAQTRLKIGELAKQTGTTADTIRFYERQSLLPKPPRTSAGYRMYDGRSLDRLKFIRKAQRMGFTLAQIKTILAERDLGNAPCESVVAMTRRKLEEVDAEIKQLRRISHSLKRYLAEWDGDGASSCCAAEDFCSLITRTEI